MNLLHRQSLPADAAASLAAALGRRPRVLGWAGSADGFVVGLVDALWVRGANDAWLPTPWHEIDSGSWDEESRTLRLRVGERTDELVLTDPNAFPDLFNERVTASIIALRRVDLGAGRHVTLALRRDLADGATAWRVLPGPRVDLSDPAVAARVEAALEVTRAEYDIA